MTVLLFTQWFPYNRFQEQSFLQEELQYLLSNFEEVILVPKIVEGELFDLPEGFTVDTSLADRLKQISWRTKLQLMRAPTFYREVLLHARRPVKLRFAIAKGLAALTYRDWLIEKYGDHSTPLILYSFWMDSPIVGSLMSRSAMKAAKVVSRCHNFDIYGNADNDFYVPYFHYAYRRLDAVFPDSVEGEAYLKQHVPGVRLQQGIMGVPRQKNLNEGSRDGMIRILSCAYVVERKRVGLLAKALLNLIERKPELQIEWMHIGEGPLFEELRELANALNERGVKTTLFGNMDHARMIDLYSSTPIDLFVNSSTHEGTPVSLMEAISFGVPLFVSACGGNARMVEKGAGWSFPVAAEEMEIAMKLEECITGLLDDKERAVARNKAFAVWDQFYNSERNYTEFCAQLKSLVE